MTMVLGFSGVGKARSDQSSQGCDHLFVGD